MRRWRAAGVAYFRAQMTRALDLIERRFLGTQGPDGSWTYGMDTVGVPRELFTPTFASSRVIG